MNDTYEELIADEVLGSEHLWMLIVFVRYFWRGLIPRELRKIVF